MSYNFYLEDIGDNKLELVYYLGNGYTDRHSTGILYNKNYIEYLLNNGLNLGEGLNIRKNEQSAHTYSLFYSCVSDFDNALLEKVKKLAIKDRIDKIPLFKHCETYYTVVYREYPSCEWKYLTTLSDRFENNNIGNKSPDEFIYNLSKELDKTNSDAYILLTPTERKDYTWCNLRDIMRFIGQTEKVDLIELRESFEDAGY